MTRATPLTYGNGLCSPALLHKQLLAGPALRGLIDTLKHRVLGFGLLLGHLSQFHETGREGRDNILGTPVVNWRL